MSIKILSMAVLVLAYILVGKVIVLIKLNILKECLVVSPYLFLPNNLN
jgi:hypothetical protein